MSLNLHAGPLICRVFSVNTYCCCSVPKLCPTLCNPMDCKTSVFPVHHLPEYAQTHVVQGSTVLTTVNHLHLLSPPRPLYKLCPPPGALHYQPPTHKVTLHLVNSYLKIWSQLPLEAFPRPPDNVRSNSFFTGLPSLPWHPSSLLSTQQPARFNENAV